MHKAHIRLRSSIFAGKRDFCSCLCLFRSDCFLLSSFVLIPNHISAAMSDSSVVLPMRPVKQVSVLSAAAAAVVTPSKIQSLLDEEEEEDEVSDDEDQENRTPDAGKPLIREETPFKLYLHSSPDTASPGTSSRDNRPASSTRSKMSTTCSAPGSKSKSIWCRCPTSRWTTRTCPSIASGRNSSKIWTVCFSILI
jgi:hypothetical protein